MGRSDHLRPDGAAIGDRGRPEYRLDPIFPYPVLRKSRRNRERQPPCADPAVDHDHKEATAMKIPLGISYRKVEKSDALELLIREKAAKKDGLSRRGIRHGPPRIRWGRPRGPGLMGKGRSSP